MILRNFHQRPEHFVLLLKLVLDGFRFLLKVGLLIDGQSNHFVHSQHLIAKLHAMLKSLVSLSCNFFQPLLSILKK